MTSLQIKDLPAAGSIDGTELAEIQLAAGGAGSSKQTTLAAIAALIQWGMIGGTLADQTDLQTAIDALVPTSDLAIANGVATLGSDSKLLAAQIPTSLLGQVSYQGTWDASAGTPPSGSPTKGQYWIVNVSGSTSLSGITDWNLGDWAIYDGTAWDKVDNTDAVSSVAGLTGVISTASLQAALGLGTAAYTAASAYATSAQGLLAASALQPDAGGQLTVTARRRKLVALGNISGSVNIDLSSAGVITATLTGATTLTWTNLPASGYVADIELRLSQDATGSRVVTWPASGKWPGGAAFVLTTAASSMDVVGASIDSAGAWIGYPVEAVA